MLLLELQADIFRSLSSPCDAPGRTDTDRDFRKCTMVLVSFHRVRRFTRGPKSQPEILQKPVCVDFVSFRDMGIVQCCLPNIFSMQVWKDLITLIITHTNKLLKH